ncbi:MAG: hypothetical protein H7Y86_04240 [Rhizobacter sp.]|nr:hypothetical protein [Ferruginibacter sp.]
MDAPETKIYYAIMACGLVVVLLTIIFVCSSVWLQRRFQIKNQLKSEAEVSSMENERKRIAADLHDEAGPLIYSMQKKFEYAKGVDESSEGLLSEGREQLMLLNQKIKEISKNLVPLSLDRKGLMYSIKELVTETVTNNDLDIKLSSCTLPELTKNEETHLFRILQEILFNTLKHSKASHLVIEITTDSRFLVLRTSDNGLGFSKTALKKRDHGAGIDNIMTRARFLNGSAFFTSFSGCKWEIKVSPGCMQQA